MEEAISVQELENPEGGVGGMPVASHGGGAKPFSSPSSEETILSVAGLSKRYTLWNEPIDRLRAPLLRESARLPFLPPRFSGWIRAKADGMAREFYALKEIGFAVKRGESLGIIGRNGAGKSTLLQILAGTLKPTTGEVFIKGRVSALLELGSGFNGEFTGRENVYLQAALAGVSRREAEERFEEVAAFANIGDFVEQPVKTYSTGMMLRLAFATQTILDPDIFIVDEALAVGDIFFVSKCTRFFEKRLAEGMSLVLVSHDIPAVKSLCEQALVLDEGRPVYLGDCSRAESVFHEIHEAAVRKANTVTPLLGEAPVKPGCVPIFGASLPENAQLRNWSSENEIGSREAEIIHCAVLDKNGDPKLSFFQDEAIRIDFYVKANKALENCHFSFQVADSFNNVVYGVSTINLRLSPRSFKAGEVRRWKTELRGVGLGKYLIDAVVFLGDRGDGCPVYHIHRVGGIASITVGQKGARPTFVGLADLRAAIAFE